MRTSQSILALPRIFLQDVHSLERGPYVTSGYSTTLTDVSRVTWTDVGRGQTVGVRRVTWTDGGRGQAVNP